MRTVFVFEAPRHRRIVVVRRSIHSLLQLLALGGFEGRKQRPVVFCLLPVIGPNPPLADGPMRMVAAKKNSTRLGTVLFWRRHPESDRG